MEADCIAYKDTGYFSKIIVDYLEENETLKSFYNYSPQLSSFSEAIKNKQFTKESRQVLANSLKAQYEKDGIKLSKYKTVLQHIDLLENEETYTVTTGHQLNLFTGPLYFIFKIASTIKLAKTLKTKYPNQNFVPIYWMATEDHDFAEINHFYFKGKKFEWNSDQTGAAGRMNLDGLDEVFKEFSKEFVEFSSNGELIKQLFKTAYTKHKNLTAATRFIANELFSDYGLVIIDGDDIELKKLFSPIVKQELLSEFSSEEVGKTNEKLAANFKIQVNPREINLFYLKDNLRERIIKSDDGYFINDTELVFSEEEILTELENHPERFSPNVILRPVYQEKILPNLAYIGGGGELAYWFQLKTTFEKVGVEFPVLLLRNSALILDEKQQKFIAALEIDLKQLFKNEGVLVKEWIIKNSKSDLTLTHELNGFSKLFKTLAKQANNIDKSLVPHVDSMAVKQQKTIQNLSEKLIRVERKKQTDATAKIEYLKDTLFPKGGLQERKENYSVFYVTKGKELISDLIETFEIPSTNFYVFKK